MGDAPKPPGKPAGELDPAKIDGGGSLADRRQIAVMPVVEWTRHCVAGKPRLDGRGNMLALLLGCGRDARHRLSIGPQQMCGVAYDEDLRAAWYGQIGFDQHSACPVCRCSEPFRRR